MFGVRLRMGIGRPTGKNDEEIGYFPRWPLATRGDGEMTLLSTNCMPDIAKGECFQNFWDLICPRLTMFLMFQYFNSKEQNNRKIIFQVQLKKKHKFWNSYVSKTLLYFYILQINWNNTVCIDLHLESLIQESSKPNHGVAVSLLQDLFMTGFIYKGWPHSLLCPSLLSITLHRLKTFGCVWKGKKKFSGYVKS